MATAFTPEHLEYTGSLSVARPLEQAFLLFTPEGERAWVPGWNPEYLWPRDGTTTVGTTFRTNAGGEETLWYVVRYEPEKGQAQYVRVTPGSRLGAVTIDCQGVNHDETIVNVTYKLTALTVTGNETLAKFDRQSFDSMLKDWAEKTAALGCG